MPRVTPQRHKGDLGDPDPKNQQIDDSSCDHVDQSHLLKIPNLSVDDAEEDTPIFFGWRRRTDIYLKTKNTIENT